MKPEVNLNSILTTTSEVSGLGIGEMLATNRARKLARSRHIAMYLARKHLGRSLPALGARFDMHHTTIMHGHQKIQEILDDPTHPEYATVGQKIESIELRLEITGKSAVEHRPYKGRKKTAKQKPKPINITKEQLEVWLSSANR